MKDSLLYARIIAKYIQDFIAPTLFLSLICGGLNILIYGENYHILHYIIKSISIPDIVFISSYSLFMIYFGSFFSALCLYFIIFWAIIVATKIKNIIILKSLFNRKEYKLISYLSIIYFFAFLIIILARGISFNHNNIENVNKLLWMIYCGLFLNVSYFCILSLNIRKIFIFPCFLIIPPFTIFTALYVVPALSNNIFINMSYATSESDMILIRAC